MDRLIYTALSGASQTLYEQQISANNLANVNTNGFRADMAMATNDKVKGGGFDTRYMAQEGASGVNDIRVAEKTERLLDVAIQGAGYIAVQDKNGNEVYTTRNGNIQQDDQGNATIHGNLVLGDNGPIILLPNAIASFGSDGTLSVTPDDGDVTATMDIDRLKLVDIPVADLAKNGEGMLVTADGVLAQRDENIKVSGGFLEGSNVSAVSEMMSSIAMNRQFEAQIKMMKTAEDIMTRATAYCASQPHIVGRIRRHAASGNYAAVPDATLCVLSGLQACAQPEAG